MVEDRVRQYGPFIFIGNWNGQGFHAVLVVGREIQEDEDALDEVLYIDPASGQVLHVNIEYFNRMMSSIRMQQGNPIYYPPAVGRRRTVIDRRD